MTELPITNTSKDTMTHPLKQVRDAVKAGVAYHYKEHGTVHAQLEYALTLFDSMMQERGDVGRTEQPVYSSSFREWYKNSILPTHDHSIPPKYTKEALEWCWNAAIDTGFKAGMESALKGNHLKGAGIATERESVALDKAGMSMVRWKPTHWMPLPKPPTNTAEG